MTNKELEANNEQLEYIVLITKELLEIKNNNILELKEIMYNQKQKIYNLERELKKEREYLDEELDLDDELDLD